MTTFTFLLFLLSAGIFYLFFKQLFSGNHPKRGVDFEAKVSDKQIGGINRPDKTFSKPIVVPTRMAELLRMSEEAIEKEDFLEAKKALGAALIVDNKNSNALHRIGYVCVQLEAYEEAKEYYKSLLSIDSKDDMAHAALANVLHQLKEEEEAQKHHEEAIMLDKNYAPHHFNYANTLYDLGRNKEALVGYSRAYELDNSLDVAKEMIEKLEG